MEKKFKRTTVTSALPYANGPVHIGHLAGVYVPADIYVRYLRLKKEDVIFIGGSDEHGVPITIRAKKEGIHPARRGGPLSYTYQRSLSKSSASHSTCTAVLLQRRITTRLPTSSASCTIRENSSKRPACSITTKKPRPSLPTATSPASAPTAMPKALTVTNARSAAPASAPRT